MGALSSKRKKVKGVVRAWMTLPADHPYKMWTLYSDQKSIFTAHKELSEAHFDARMAGCHRVYEVTLTGVTWDPTTGMYHAKEFMIHERAYTTSAPTPAPPVPECSKCVKRRSR